MRKLLRILLHPGVGLGHRVVSAGFWAFALRGALRLAILARTVVLARILAPSDFGLMGIAVLAILMLERFTETGFNAALVQKKDDIRPYLNTAWTLAIARNTLIALLLVLGSPLIALFFGVPEVALVIRVLAVSVLFKGFTNVAMVFFEKELRFDRRFLFEISDKGTDVVVSIIAALMLRNVWALVFGVVAGSLVRVGMSYILHPYRPRLQWETPHAKELFSFGKWILGTNVVGYFSGNLDDILVGRIMAVSALGHYRMAYNFSQAVATELTQVVNQVAFPTYSQLQTEVSRVRDAYLTAFHLVAFLAFPLAVGTVLLAEDLTVGLLGEKWLPMVPALQVLSVAGLMRGLGATTGPLFQAQGRPDLPAKITGVKVAILAAILYPAIDRFGLVGAAGATVFAGTLTAVGALVIAARWFSTTAGEIRQVLVFPALNTALMGMAILGARAMFFPEPSTLSLFSLALVGVAVYFLSVSSGDRFLGYSHPRELIGRLRGLTP